MPYPHVTQFETLDLRRRQVLGTGEALARRALRRGRRRSRLTRLRRARPCGAEA